VRIWPRTTVGLKKVGELEGDGEYCRIDCQFMIGDEFAKGLQIMVHLDDPKDVRFRYVQFLGLRDSKALSDELGSKYTQVVWQAKDLKPAKRYQFSVRAEGKAKRTEGDWSRLVERTTVRFGFMPSEKLRSIAPSEKPR
jgi:hypothetical protein